MTKARVIRKEQVFYRAEDVVVADDEGVAYGDAFVRVDDCYAKVAHYPNRAPEVLGVEFERRIDGPGARNPRGA